QGDERPEPCMGAAGFAATGDGDEPTGDEQIASLGMVIQHVALQIQVAPMPFTGCPRRLQRLSTFPLVEGPRFRARPSDTLTGDGRPSFATRTRQKKTGRALSASVSGISEIAFPRLPAVTRRSMTRRMTIAGVL